MQHILLAAWLCAVSVQALSRTDKMTWLPSTWGPYVARLLRSYECPRDGTWEPKVEFSMRATRYSPFRPNERQRVTGNVSLHLDVADDDWGNMMIEWRRNNEWKKNWFLFPMRRGVCSLARTHLPLTFKAFFGDEVDGICIMKSGNYNALDREIDSSIQRFPVIRYGSYRATVRVGKAGSETANVCFHLEIDILQKPSS